MLTFRNFYLFSAGSASIDIMTFSVYHTLVLFYSYLVQENCHAIPLYWVTPVKTLCGVIKCKGLLKLSSYLKKKCQLASFFLVQNSVRQKGLFKLLLGPSDWPFPRSTRFALLAVNTSGYWLNCSYPDISYI